MIIVTMIILAFMCISQGLKKEYMSPLFIFPALWIVVLFLYNLRLYGIYEISLNTEVILFLGIIGFLIGATFFKYISIKPKHYLYSNKICFTKIKIVFFVVFILSLNFYIPNIIKVLQGTTVNEIKMMMVTGDIDLGGITMQYIVRPFTYIIIAVSTYCMFYRRDQKTLIALGGIYLIFEFFGAGSKTIILYTILCIALPTARNITGRTHKHFGKKTIIIILALFLFVFMGSKSVYFYISGCIPMLDKVINTSFYMPSGYAMGFVSFNSIVRFLVKVVSLFGVNLNLPLFEQGNLYITRFEYTTEVGYGLKYNAFHTFIGDFYVDFGIIGVIAFSIMFGMLRMYIYRLYKKTNGSILSHILYCIILYYIAFSLVRFQMSNTFLGLMLIYSLTIVKFITYNTKLSIIKK